MLEEYSAIFRLDTGHQGQRQLVSPTQRLHKTYPSQTSNSVDYIHVWTFAMLRGWYVRADSIHRNRRVADCLWWWETMETMVRRWKNDSSCIPKLGTFVRSRWRSCSTHTRLCRGSWASWRLREVFGLSSLGWRKSSL